MTVLLGKDLRNTEDAVLFMAAGFEERSVAYLNDCATRGVRYYRVVVVDYRPVDERNRLDEAVQSARQVGLHIKEETFDRFQPFESDGLDGESLDMLCEKRDVVLDVSGMSRFLIVVLATRLIRAGVSVTVAYTEPDVYHPTEAEFLSRTQAGQYGQASQMFLTTGLFDITTVPDLTHAVMSGEPEALVASPGFEPRFIRALINELAPSVVVLLEGIPPDSLNRWRRDAVRRLNAVAFETADKVIPVSTASVNESRSALQNVFKEYKYTHRMIVVPAASKLGAVGMAEAISTEVECEVVYPTPVRFQEPYTDGTRDTRFVEIRLDRPVDAFEA